MDNSWMNNRDYRTQLDIRVQNNWRQYCAVSAGPLHILISWTKTRSIWFNVIIKWVGKISPNGLQSCCLVYVYFFLNCIKTFWLDLTWIAIKKRDRHMEYLPFIVNHHERRIDENKRESCTNGFILQQEGHIIRINSARVYITEI